MKNEIQITVRLFGAFRKYADGAFIQLQVAPQTGLEGLRQALLEKLQALDPHFQEEKLIWESAFANESTVLSADAKLQENCTIAVLPPVCGG